LIADTFAEICPQQRVEQTDLVAQTFMKVIASPTEVTSLE